MARAVVNPRLLKDKYESAVDKYTGRDEFVAQACADAKAPLAILVAGPANYAAVFAEPLQAVARLTETLRT